MLSHVFFKMTKQVTIWKCKVRTIWWVQKHCPYSDDLWCTQMSVSFHCHGEAQRFRHLLDKRTQQRRLLSVSIQQMVFTGPLRPFLSKKTVTTIFQLKTHSRIYSKWGFQIAMFHKMLLWIGFKMVGPGFNSPWQSQTGNPHLWCHIGNSHNCFPCPFVCIYQHPRHEKSKYLRIAKLFSNCHYTAFTDGTDGA